MSNFKRSYALIIGINNYNNGIFSLKTAVSDATEIAHLLETKHHYTVNLLVNEAATLSKLRQVLETELPKQIQKSDRFLFYFAGHGIALNGEDGPEGYLIPQDAQLCNVSTYLPMPELNKALLELSCRHFLGILDCCFAGAFRWSSTRKAIPCELVTIHKERYDRFIQDPAWQVITSAAYDQTAFDAFDLKDDRGQKGVHSPFASALIEALEGKADAFPPAETGKPAGDGVITADELYLYLRDRVEIATEARAIRQTPGIHCLNKHDKGEYIFLAPGHQLNLPPAPPLDVTKNPYRGLSPFEEEHCDLFFGRKALTQKLYEFVTSHSLTVVLGASGSGKSSLVKAGLIPKLRQCKDDNTWFILPAFRPGESPFKALNSALASVNLPAIAIPSAATSSGLLTPIESLANWFKEHPKANLLLIVDQFEELITLCRNDEERQQFLAALKEAIAAYPHQLHLILTLRSDFEPQFSDTELKPYWQAAKFNIPEMSREEFRQAIEEPASARVMFFDPHELVDQLIDEVINMPGGLPLLSFALSELYLRYLKRQEDVKNRGETVERAITWADYEEVGGVARSVTQRANLEYEELVNQDSAYAQTIRNVMLRMVAVGGELARRRVPMSELEYPEPENTRVKAVIQSFSEARLLTNGIDSDSQPYVEPAHDALVRGWQKLLEWKQQDLASLLLQRELTPTANKWASNRKEKQSSGLLWDDDPRLPLVKQISEQRANWLNSPESEFVRCSIWQKYRNVCLRRLVGGSFVTIAICAAFFFNYLREVAQLRSDIATAQNLLTTDPTQGLVLAIRSAARARSRFTNLLSNVEPTLFNALEASREINIINGHNAAINSIAVARNSQKLVSASEDGTVKLWDIKGGLIKKLNDDGIPDTAVAFSRNGKYIASANKKEHMCIWDGEGNLYKCYQKAGIVLAFSPQNDNLLVTGSKDGKVQLWNLSDSAPYLNNHSQILDKDPTPITALAFTHDKNIIAIGRENGVILWNIKTQSLSQRLTLSEQDSATGMMLSSLAFSHDDKYLVGGWSFPEFAYEKPKIVLWQLKYGANNDAKPTLYKVLLAHDLSANTVVFNPLSNSFATGGDDNNIHLWDIEGNPVGSAFLGHKGTVRSVAFSPDSKTIISGSEDGTIRFWRQEKTLASFSIDNIEDEFELYSSKCNQIKISHNKLSLEWQLSQQNPEILTKINPAQTNFFCSHDAKTIAIIEGNLQNEIKIFNQNATSQPIKMHLNKKVNLIALNSQKRRIVIVPQDNKLEVRDFQGKLINEPFLHPGEVRDIVFNPDGRTIATLSLATKGHHVEGMEGIVRLWNIEGNLIYKYQLHFNGEVVFALGTHFLFTTSGKGLIYPPEEIVLPGNVQALMNIACHQLKTHPVFKNPVGFIYKNTAIDAKKDCEVINGME